jgi:nitroreductase
MSDATDFSLRDPLSGVDPQFPTRWSPRAFKKTPVPDNVLARLIDAARFAPSCFNEQPWRFYTSNQRNFEEFLHLLLEGNQLWAKNAAVIGFLVVERHFARNNTENQHARFDAGAAWMSLCLQAQREGLCSHGMGGIKYDEIATYLQLDNNSHDVVMGFAIGEIGDKTDLPEALAEKEQPSPRKPLDEIWPNRHSAG